MDEGATLAVCLCHQGHYLVPNKHDWTWIWNLIKCAVPACGVHVIIHSLKVNLRKVCIMSYVAYYLASKKPKWKVYKIYKTVCADCVRVSSWHILPDSGTWPEAEWIYVSSEDSENGKATDVGWTFNELKIIHWLCETHFVNNFLHYVVLMHFLQVLWVHEIEAVLHP